MSYNVIYSKEFVIESTPKNWENGLLGEDEIFVQVAEPLDEDALNDAIENCRIFWEE